MVQMGIGIVLTILLACIVIAFYRYSMVSSVEQEEDPPAQQEDLP